MINKEKLAAPKGTRDSVPGSLILKNKLIKIIERNFVLFGFDAWDGPTFENIEVLTAKSGDEIKGQIYNFVDKGGRELGLRFDLTTTLARIIASNPNLKKPIRCYNYGSAFRYENTQKGRYREFFQIDADVFGVDTVEAEMELMGIVSKTMLDLGISNAYIVINDRKILSAITEKCNIPQTKSATVLRCIDKLDKVGFDNVRKELLDCGITTTQIDSLFAILEINGTLEEKINQFKEIFVDYPIILKSLSEIQEIADKCEIEVRFEPTLVRGQDYYTGMIYEYKIPNDLSIGSVGGGGRYDNYVETFGGAKTSAVGISFGVDRMIDIIEQDKALCAHILKSENKTFVANFNQKDLEICKLLATKLRKRGIPTVFDINGKKYDKQYDFAKTQNYVWFVTVGENKDDANLATIKNLATNEKYVCSIENIDNFVEIIV